MDFVKTPYIPTGKTTLAVADCERKDIKIIKPYCAKVLPEGLRYHADLTFCYLGGGIAVCAPESYDYYKHHTDKTSLILIPGEKSLDRHYPCDAAYNIAIVGDKVFCKTDITDKVLLDKCEELGYKIININQGYAKCSVCPIDESSAISADKSFFVAAEKNGVEVLLITNDTIELKGFSNGFFGGCAYMENKNVLSAQGSMEKHPDFNRICEFLSKKEKIINPGLSGALYDFGSFIPIMEE